jgi:FMN phosphatase YigB (HAD superfamily)
MPANGSASVSEIDMIAWDFGDTLVDEQLMRMAPQGFPGWADAVNDLLQVDRWAERWELGEVCMNELVVPLAERLSMPPTQVARHLRATWRSPRVLEPAMKWLHQLSGVVAQVIVTVNPYEFHGVATATGFDSLVDLIVTSADVRSRSKVVQARQARRWLGRDEDLSTTVLVDNKAANITEFRDHGGQAVLFVENDPALDGLLSPLVTGRDRAHRRPWQVVSQPPEQART